MRLKKRTRLHAADLAARDADIKTQEHQNIKTLEHENTRTLKNKNIVLNYKEKLRSKMDDFVHEVFHVTKSFPKDELYITVSQLKRAALSIILNYTEGYARIKKGNQLQFLQIGYGSAQEVKYLIDFSKKKSFISDEIYKKLSSMIDGIGKMLWVEIRALSKSLEK